MRGDSSNYENLKNEIVRSSSGVYRGPGFGSGSHGHKRATSFHDRGKTVTDLALKAPGGAFDPRDLEKIPAEKLGYKADWLVERYKRYNLDWDITGLRLTSLNPEAKKYPWLIIMNGGAANFY